jgi:hypothetical protein
MKRKSVYLYITLTSILLLLKGKLQWPSGSLRNEWKRKERKKQILFKESTTEPRSGEEEKYLAAPRGTSMQPHWTKEQRNRLDTQNGHCSFAIW